MERRNHTQQQQRRGRRQRRRVMVHAAATAKAAGGTEPELEVGWASLVLDGGFLVGAFLDSGSVTHNFVCKKVAQALRDRGLASSPAAFRVTGVGAVTAGAI